MKRFGIIAFLFAFTFSVLGFQISIKKCCHINVEIKLQSPGECDKDCCKGNSKPDCCQSYFVKKDSGLLTVSVSKRNDSKQKANAVIPSFTVVQPQISQLEIPFSDLIIPDSSVPIYLLNSVYRC
ncbi:MAG: hypothetical protein GC181_03210 [Bacteroidetes bacterium]|nr:hypothetical protein [Bacteroidota bacterium]